MNTSQHPFDATHRTASNVIAPASAQCDRLRFVRCAFPFDRNERQTDREKKMFVMKKNGPTFVCPMTYKKSIFIVMFICLRKLSGQIFNDMNSVPEHSSFSFKLKWMACRFRNWNLFYHPSRRVKAFWVVWRSNSVSSCEARSRNFSKLFFIPS